MAQKGLSLWDREAWGNITSASYIQNISPLIQQFKQVHEIFRVGLGNAILMQDNASPHRAACCYYTAFP